MEQELRIRRQVLVEGISKQQVLHETRMHWTTLEKILSCSSSAGTSAKGTFRLQPFLLLKQVVNLGHSRVHIHTLLDGRLPTLDARLHVRNLRRERFSSAGVGFNACPEFVGNSRS